MTRITPQYRIIEAGAGWIDRSARGRLRLAGRDAASFLQALLTNDMDAVAPGQGMDAAYLTPQGRMIAMLRVLRRADEVLAGVAPGQGAVLADRFDRLIFAEDVRVADVTGTLGELSVIGGDAAGCLARALGIDAGAIASLSTLEHVQAGEVLVARTDDAALAGYDLWMPAASFDDVARRLGGAGAVEIDAALDEGLRIDRGRPRFGVDMTEDTIPLEAGLLERAISTTKGCYVGQEVIIRVLHRGGGRVARRLVQLAFDPVVASPPEAGTPLFANDAETGRMTSAAISPRSGRAIALGYVHRDAASVGAHVVARSAGAELAAEITGFAS